MVSPELILIENWVGFLERPSTKQCIRISRRRLPHLARPVLFDRLDQRE
jgi:hypothetical protein